MDNIEVSIIVATHNGQATLKECLTSILNQTYKNFEVIVVDNNSTDNTKNIILDFQKKDSRIKYVFEKYQSRGAARNTGIQVAQADVITMTDSDCITPTDWLTKIIQPILNNSELIVQGNEQDIMNNYWTSMQQEFNQNFLKRHTQDKYIDHLDTKNFAIKKEILEKIEGFNKDIKNLEDFELKVRLKKADYKIYFLADLKVKHFHKDNFKKLVARRFDQGYWTAKIYLIHKKYFKKHPEEMVKSIQPIYFFIFIPWTLFFLLKNGFKKFFFEITTGVAWRLGIIAGLLKI